MIVLQQELMQLGDKCPPHWSCYAILSALGKTLKLLWGQRWIPLSSCRLSRWTLGQYHVSPSLTFVVRLTPLVLWYPAIIFILFSNYFVLPSVHEDSLCSPITDLSTTASYQLRADFSCCEPVVCTTFQASRLLLNFHPFFLPLRETWGTFILHQPWLSGPENPFSPDSLISIIRLLI